MTAENKIIYEQETVSRRLDAIRLQTVLAVAEFHRKLTLLVEQEGALMSLEKIDAAMPPPRLTNPLFRRENFRLVK